MSFLNEGVVADIINIDQDHDPDITVLKWDVMNTIQAGDNYSSQALRLIVDYENHQQRHRKLLFLKVPANSPMYQFGTQCDIYKKEILMCTKIFPEMRKIDSKPFTAKYFRSMDKEVLVLKDLAESGYRTANRIEQLDIEHTIQAVKCLAKFHALSVKLDQLNLLPEDMKRDNYYTSFNTNEESKLVMRKILEKFVEKLRPAERIKYRRKLQHLMDNFWDQVVAEMAPKKNAFMVLNHGDFKTNNVMFKYDKFDNIEKTKILDFQLCHWGSPANDLLFFFITSVQFEVFQNYSELILKIYTNTLNKMLKYLGCQTYDVDELRREIDSKFTFAFFVCTGVLGVTLAKPEEPFDFEKSMTKDAILYWEDVAWRNKYFVGTSLKWFRYYAQKGFFEDKGDDLRLCMVETFVQNLKKNNPISIYDYNLQSNIIEEGKNFCSGISRLNVEYMKHNRICQISVILKIPSEGVLYERLKSIIEFNNEIVMYNQILPKMYELWNGDTFTAMNYLPSMSNNLVLEDLSVHGYRVATDKKRQLDLLHSVVALKILAKLHGLSVKFLSESPALVSLIKPIARDDAENSENFTKMAFEKLANTIKFLTTDSTLLSKVKMCYEENREEIMKQVYGQSFDDGFNVLCHGDFHLNNVLFKYNSDGEIEDAKMIDFQIPHCGSPVADLIYFFVTSVQADVFVQYDNYLINVYMSTLEEVMRTLKCERLYSREDLANDMKKLQAYYVYIIALSLPVILNDSENLLGSENRNGDMYRSPLYHRSLLTWMDYLQSKSFI